MPNNAQALSRTLRVLLVDDEFLILDYLAFVLESVGHTVVGTATSGSEALSLLDGVEVDLAIVDIKLKGDMDGIDLARELSRHGVPHLFISGSGDPATFQRAQETEPLAFLQKPFNEEQLLAALGGMTALG